MLSQQLMNLGIVAIGAIALCVTAFFMFKPAQGKTAGKKKQAVGKNKQAAGKKKQAAVQKEQDTGQPKKFTLANLKRDSQPLEEAPLQEQTEKTAEKNKEGSPVWKTRRSLIQGIRKLRGRIPRPAKQNETKEQPAEVLIPDIEEILPSPEELTEETEETAFVPDIRDETITQMPDTAQTEPEPASEDETNTAGGETVKEEIGKTLLNTEEPEATDEETKQQAEQLISESEQKPPAKEETKTGSVFDLFKDEMKEESTSGKFAANLKQVDINALLEDVRNLKKIMH